MADARKLKEKATEAFQKGKFVRAAEAYAEYCEADPKDLQARLRMGDAWNKGGKKDKAIAAYSWAAEGFAKEGFLPRAIAASKLILELDPAHQGVQKMLADLYARKTTAPLGSGGGRAAAPMKIETRVEVQTTAAGFANRKDAIELDARPNPPARRPSAPAKPDEPPSPMNRKDAIELPAYEIPGLEVAPASGSASVPMAARGPSPTRRVDAIEIEVEEARRDGPAALLDSSIELDVSVTGSQPIAPPPRPSGPEIHVEVELEAPAQSFELKVEPPAPPPPPPRPPAPEQAKVWDLESEELPEELEVVESVVSEEIALIEVAESDLPPVPPPPPRPELEVIGPPPPPRPEQVIGPPPAPRPELEVIGPPPPPRSELEVIGPPPPPRPEVAVIGPPPSPRSEPAVIDPPPPPRSEPEVIGPPPPPRPEVAVIGPPPPPRPEVEVIGPPPPPRPQLDVTGPPPPPRSHLEVIGEPVLELIEEPEPVLEVIFDEPGPAATSGVVQVSLAPEAAPSPATPSVVMSAEAGRTPMAAMVELAHPGASPSMSAQPGRAPVGGTVELPHPGASPSVSAEAGRTPGFEVIREPAASQAPSARPELEVLGELEPAGPVRPSEQSGSFSRSSSPGEKSGSFNAPPGMKPRRSAPEAPASGVADHRNPVVDYPGSATAGAPGSGAPGAATAADAAAPGRAAAAGPSPSAPRIWLPGNFAPPTVTALAEELSPAAPIAPAAIEEPTSPEALTDLERGLQIFAMFDAEDFRPSKPAPPPAPPPPEPVPAPARAAPARRTFTELELEGDSLLHAVETAAAVGVEQRGEQDGQPLEEGMDLADDQKLEPGELPKIPLFSDLPPDAFIALFERCPLKRVEPGEIVIQQGSLGDSFYVICAGSVRVFRMDAEQRREIATLEEGAFFGEMALLSGAARTASVEAASEDTQLLEISAPILTELSHRYPQVATALKKFCRQRLLANLMSSATLFQSFSRNDRRDLVQRFRARDVSKGDVLIKEGSRSDGMYVILSGEVEVRVGPTQVATLKEGEVFGEMSLLTKTNATATVAASKRTSLLRLPREDFDLIIMSHPQVLVIVSELTDSRSKQNAALASGRPRARDAAPMV